MSDVTAYFESLKDIEQDKLFITERLDELEKEVSRNCWSISMPQELAASVSSRDLINFLNRVKTNRKQQLLESNLDVDMQMYVWFDEQACHLRVNLINSMHSTLPFACRYRVVDKPDVIVELFLASKHHDGVAFSELADVSRDRSEELYSGVLIQQGVLQVYSTVIKAC